MWLFNSSFISNIFNVMKQYLKHVSPYVIIIAIMFVIIIIMQQCNGGKVKTETVYKTKTDTLIKYNDRIIEGEKIYIPYDKIVYRDVPADVDTAEILKQYYAVYYTPDVILNNDSVAYIALFDSISQNRVIYRRYEYKDNTPTQIITNTTIVDTCKECKRFNLGFGGFLGGNQNTFQAGISIMLQTNKKAAYTVSYDVINKTAQAGIYWTIK